MHTNEILVNEKSVVAQTNKAINFKRVMFTLAMAALGTFMFSFPAFAATVSAGDMMTKLISLMCSMFKYVGTAVFVWAIIQFILATKRSDADSKADAVQTAVCGIALMAIALIVNSLGITSAIEGAGTISDDTFGK